MQRDCSSPFHITPYKGKYPAVPTTPDALHLQRVLAGCADRGAGTTLVELEPAALVDGRCACVGGRVGRLVSGDGGRGARQLWQLPSKQSAPKCWLSHCHPAPMSWISTFWCT